MIDDEDEDEVLSEDEYKDRIEDLETELEDLQDEVDAWAKDMADVIVDRQRLLGHLGLTEHEWWCLGGSKLGDVDPPRRKTKVEPVRVGLGVSKPASAPEAVPVEAPTMAEDRLRAELPGYVEDVPQLFDPRLPPIESFSGEHRFLSNFWQVKVNYEGRIYPSTEHAYQAAKTLDTRQRARIAGAATSGDAKAFGRSLTLRSDWEDVKIEVMRTILKEKFAQPDLRDKLLATGQRWLIEGNHWGDKFWGVCGGTGQNHLGRLLMEIRLELRLKAEAEASASDDDETPPPLPDDLCVEPSTSDDSDEPPPLPPELCVPDSHEDPGPARELSWLTEASEQASLRGDFDDDPDAAGRPRIAWGEEHFDLDEDAYPTSRPNRSGIVYTPEQEEELSKVRDWLRDENGGRFYALTGPAGSGKSTLVEDILRENSAMLTAMTGKAALRLSQVTGRPATTLHRELYWPPKPGEGVQFTRLREPPAHRLLVTDEAGMMGPGVKRDLGNWGWNLRILLVGDSFQLPPVITGREKEQYGEDYSVFSEVKGAALETVMRNAGGVLRAATHVRMTGEVPTESMLDADGQGGYEHVRCNDALEEAVERWLADRDDHFLVTWRNETRMRANAVIRQRLGMDGPLPDPGEPVLIKKNNEFFMNGEIIEAGTFEDGPKIADVSTLWMTLKDGRRLLVSVEGGPRDKGGTFFDGGLPWVKDFKAYNIALNKLKVPEPVPLTWGYVNTGHGVQGDQRKRSTVFLSRGDMRSTNFNKPSTLPDGRVVPFSARWNYTALSRAKKIATMIVGK